MPHWLKKCRKAAWRHTCEQIKNNTWNWQECTSLICDQLVTMFNVKNPLTDIHFIFDIWSCHNLTQCDVGLNINEFKSQFVQRFLAGRPQDVKRGSESSELSVTDIRQTLSTSLWTLDTNTTFSHVCKKALNIQILDDNRNNYIRIDN